MRLVDVKVYREAMERIVRRKIEENKEHLHILQINLKIIPCEPQIFWKKFI